jgi:hypothetical protein
VNWDKTSDDFQKAQNLDYNLYIEEASPHRVQKTPQDI